MNFARRGKAGLCLARALFAALSFFTPAKMRMAALGKKGEKKKRADMSSAGARNFLFR